MDISHDRLRGTESLQTTHSRIQAKITLPSNSLTGSQTIGGVTNDDYADFYLVYNDYIEAGISYAPYAGGFRVFLNTGAAYGGDTNYWRSDVISNKGLSFGFGSTVKLSLAPSAGLTTLYVNDQPIWTLNN